MRRLIYVACAVFLVGFLGCAAMPLAAADGPPPPAFPSGLPSPGSVGNSAGGSTQAPPGPTYVVTPGSKGTALPPPTTEVPKPMPTPRPVRIRRTHRAATRSRTAAAAPAAAVNEPAATSDGQEGKVLLAGSGALLMLVLTEFTRLDRRFRLHPPPGVR